MTTCCSIFGLIFLVITNLAILIAFATPYWVELSPTRSTNQGLWARCQADKCEWVFDDGYTRGGVNEMSVDSDWWYASTGLVSGGLFMSLMALLLATVALCCDCRGCNSSHGIGAMLLIAFLALGSAAVVFGVCANEEDDVNLNFDVVKGGQASGRNFGWSYWLNIGAAGLSLITSLIYIIDGRNKSDYSYAG